MGSVENTNKEVKNLLREFALFLKAEAKIECINVHRVRSDGQTAYERLKGRFYGGKVAMFGECLWYRTPDAMQLSSLERRWTTCIWVGKKQKSDEHIIIVGNEVRPARSVRRKVAGKRWNTKMPEKVLCTPWLPRLGPGTPANRPKRHECNYRRVPRLLWPEHWTQRHAQVPVPEDL